MKYLNCKEVGFTETVQFNDPYHGAFSVSFRRSSKSKTFFDLIHKQTPNQILWNGEEQQAYYLNNKNQLYKLKFEPTMKTKKQTLDEQQREEIEKLKIPWNKFCYISFYGLSYNTTSLKYLFIDLLQIVKKKNIKIKYGIGIQNVLDDFPNYNPRTNQVEIGPCVIVPELDFNLEKFDIVYDDILLVGESIVEKEDINEYTKINTNTEKSKNNGILDIFKKVF